jgi:SNF family Na+-dependent transporter
MNFNLQVKCTFVACCICYLLGLPCVSGSGQYVLDLMDTYGAGFAVLWVAIWEMIGLMWIYGVRNVCNDFKLMLGSPPSWFWCQSYKTFSVVKAHLHVRFGSAFSKYYKLALAYENTRGLMRF